MKKSISIVLALILILVCLTGCGKEETGPVKTIDLPENGVVPKAELESAKKNSTVLYVKGSCGEYEFQWAVVGTKIDVPEDTDLSVSIAEESGDVVISVGEMPEYPLSLSVSIPEKISARTVRVCGENGDLLEEASLSVYDSKTTVSINIVEGTAEYRLAFSGDQAADSVPSGDEISQDQPSGEGGEPSSDGNKTGDQKADEQKTDGQKSDDQSEKKDENKKDRENSSDDKKNEKDSEDGKADKTEGEDGGEGSTGEIDLPVVPVGDGGQQAGTDSEEHKSGETEKSDGTQTGKDEYNTDPVPEGKPLPVEPEDQEVDDDITYHCTISISCKTILDNMDDLDPEKVELVPEDGWILKSVRVSFKQGESVFDVLKRVCKNKGIHMEFSWTPMYNSAYIEGIGNLYEFDCGNLSGWMYKVNGWFPNYGCSRYVLEDGDTINWVYTCDLGYDVGGGYAVGGE